MEVENENGEKIQKANPLFVVLYLFVFLLLIVYIGVTYYYNLVSFEQAEMIRVSYYLVPTFFFAFIGMATVRSGRSLLYAIISVPVVLVLMVFFFQAIFPIILEKL